MDPGTPTFKKTLRKANSLYAIAKEVVCSDDMHEHIIQRVRQAFVPDHSKSFWVIKKEGAGVDGLVVLAVSKALQNVLH